MEGGLPSSIVEAAAAARKDLIPDKSKERYELAYNSFLNWMAKEGVPHGNYSEIVLLAYMKGLADRYSISTVWASFSMIKAVIKLRNGTDIGKYASVTAFLKGRTKGYSPKQARVFREEEVERFLEAASDSEWLDVKVRSFYDFFFWCVINFNFFF